MTQFSIGKFPLILRRNARSRSLKLRYDAKSGAAVLTLPLDITDRKAIQFAEKHHDWILAQQDKSPERKTLSDGTIIPFQGALMTIIHAQDKAPTVQPLEGCLIIGGPKMALETRLQNWLVKQARLKFKEAVESLEPILQLRPHRIVVRDTKTRWGSCSSRKTLSFSWRLIMAPPEILHYVVAHEMAHLVEMNHSPAFWAVVEKLCPLWRESRRWLKSEGNGLMIVG